jgi:hypothetical protein
LVQRCGDGLHASFSFSFSSISFFSADLFLAQDGEGNTREVLRDLKQDINKNS